MRSQPATVTIEAAPSARDGRAEEHSAWLASGADRM